MEGQILAQLDDLKNTYLAPIKQSQDRLEERVRRQELEIDSCKETIGLVKEKIETIYDEIARRFRLINRLYVKNVKDEAEARQVIDTIKGKKIEIYWMKEIPNNSKEQDLKSFTLELDAAEKREIL